MLRCGQNIGLRKEPTCKEREMEFIFYELYRFGNRLGPYIARSFSSGGGRAFCVSIFLGGAPLLFTYTGTALSNNFGAGAS